MIVSFQLYVIGKSSYSDLHVIAEMVHLDTFIDKHSITLWQCDYYYKELQNIIQLKERNIFYSKQSSHPG